MQIPVYAWATPPSLTELDHFLRQHPHAKHLVFCLRQPVFPDFTPQPNHATLARILQNALRCLNFTAPQYLPELLPNTDLWLLPQEHAHKLYQHFHPHPVIWQTEAIAQHTPQIPKPWQRLPEKPPHTDTPHVLIIGAGIAGSATAYECAKRGAHVTVLEACEPAQAASGNRQGLLYAKISAHPTEQTELLLAGYGYTRRLLEQLLPEQNTWGASGVLHLDHNQAETQRNLTLSQHTHHSHLYRYLTTQEAATVTGIPQQHGGLFWPQGVWLNPASLIHRLLQHPNIRLHAHTPLQTVHHDGKNWQAHTPDTIFSGSHIVFCTGADSRRVPIINDFPFQYIRGQTTLCTATSGSLKLRTALSGASYISPAWQDSHCFGASFTPNNCDNTLQTGDDEHNRQALAVLSPYLNEHLLSGSLSGGHAAVRSDCYDHLPAVGALGDPTAMQQLYAKLAHDKNYRINTPCPYLPNAYANTAHGSRGLATAPICAAEIAAHICGTPKPLSERLRLALNPNRLIIRKITHPKSQTPNPSCQAA